jgi:carbonic anhydrase
VKDNDDFMGSHNASYFANFQTAQHPRATIVMCSDSRGQTTSIDYTPDNDLFMVRNIGNSFQNNKGSVEYGVLHLHTPILMIIGHSECGAVKAVHSGIQGTLEPDIQKELDRMGQY